MSSRSAPRSSTAAAAALTAHARRSTGRRAGGGAGSARRSPFSHLQLVDQPHHRPRGRAQARRPVGRREERRCAAPHRRVRLARSPPRTRRRTGSAPRRAGSATSARSRAASARHAAIAARAAERARAPATAARSANSDAAEAMPQPASRSGIEETGPGSETGRMNASSSVGVAPASTELTTPANSTPNADERHRHRGQPRRCATPACRAQISTPHGDRERRLCLQPIAHRTREVDQQQHRERAEGGERRDGRVPDHLDRRARTAPA